MNELSFEPWEAPWLAYVDDADEWLGHASDEAEWAELEEDEE